MADVSTVLGNAKYGNKSVLTAPDTEPVFKDPDTQVAATTVTINDASTIIPDKFVPESEVDESE